MVEVGTGVVDLMLGIDIYYYYLMGTDLKVMWLGVGLRKMIREISDGVYPSS